MGYGAPDLVTATFVQRPIWLAKFFQNFFAFFQGENCSPHIVFAQKVVLCSYQCSLYSHLGSSATC